jgi:hypothetical protein
MQQVRSRRLPRFNSVEEYLASVEPTKESTLRSVIDLILTEFPELQSKISWNLPTIHRSVEGARDSGLEELEGDGPLI